MKDFEDVSSAASDSGYETSVQDREVPGELRDEGEFVFQAQLAFVTYSRSRFDDKEEFSKALRESLEPHLPYVGAGKRSTLEIFGSKELHEDGTPHYHAVMRFGKKPHWRKARKNFAVWIDVDGERVVDTHSIYIRTKKPREPEARFLQDVQSYVAKGGDVFGQWIGPTVTPVAEKKKFLRELVETESRAEAEALIKMHFPEKWAWGQINVQALLKTKVRPAPLPYVPDFEVLPWRLPTQVKKWCRDNFPVRGGGRPVSLVIIGPPRCGKTCWARSFGTPAVMDGRWDVDQLLQSDVTHVVLNDIVLTDFPNKRELAGCQASITVTGKYRGEKSIPWGKPAIWTCNEDNSVMSHRGLARYLRESGAVIVRVRDSLYKVASE